ncbi:MAG TPA: GNAT family N-acetyltransferase [Gaiellaceae bacterium]|jgi:GNAT superfamily N-acetyltransferase
MERRVDVRPYAPEDESVLFGLASLDRGADTRTLEVLEHETVFVAEVEGSAAGYVAVHREAKRVCVEQLFVSPDHEAQGVGRRLLEHAEGYAIAEGAELLAVVVEPGNERAAAFYRGRGFVPAERDRLELVLPRR